MVKCQSLKRLPINYSEEQQTPPPSPPSPPSPHLHFFTPPLPPSLPSKRLVRAGTKENDDCKKLLRLMGCPIVEAPCEAEAQCAALAKEGKVYASATEDMDCLTFATPVLLRKMTFANSGKAEIQVLNYAKAIEGLKLTHDEFVDLCILLGCDYCDSIRGIGPVSALKLIREHKNIEVRGMGGGEGRALLSR